MNLYSLHANSKKLVGYKHQRAVPDVVLQDAEDSLGVGNQLNLVLQMNKELLSKDALTAYKAAVLYKRSVNLDGYGPRSKEQLWEPGSAAERLIATELPHRLPSYAIDVTEKEIPEEYEDLFLQHVTPEDLVFYVEQFELFESHRPGYFRKNRPKIYRKLVEFMSNNIEILFLHILNYYNHDARMMRIPELESKIYHAPPAVWKKWVSAVMNYPDSSSMGSAWQTYLSLLSQDDYRAAVQNVRGER